MPRTVSFESEAFHTKKDCDVGTRRIALIRSKGVPCARPTSSLITCGAQRPAESLARQSENVGLQFLSLRQHLRIERFSTLTLPSEIHANGAEVGTTPMHLQIRRKSVRCSLIAAISLKLWTRTARYGISRILSFQVLPVATNIEAFELGCVLIKSAAGSRRTRCLLLPQQRRKSGHSTTSP
jgi:hypothetical protein